VPTKFALRAKSAQAAPQKPIVKPTIASTQSVPRAKQTMPAPPTKIAGRDFIAKPDLAPSHPISPSILGVLHYPR
jgi:hypothetical protein